MKYYFKTAQNRVGRLALLKFVKELGLPASTTIINNENVLQKAAFFNFDTDYLDNTAHFGWMPETTHNGHGYRSSNEYYQTIGYTYCEVTDIPDILEKARKEEAEAEEPKFQIAGFDAEWEYDPDEYTITGATFGCISFEKYELDNLLTIANNVLMESITIDGNEIDIDTLEELQEVMEGGGE